MANRNFNNSAKQSERGTVSLFPSFTMVGGVPVLGKKLGVETITVVGVGRYSFVLQDSYQRLLMARFSLLAPLTTDANFQITIDASSTKSVEFLVLVGGVETDLPDGDTVLSELIFKNSSVEF
jgi:hypothetical protein